MIKYCVSGKGCSSHATGRYGSGTRYNAISQEGDTIGQLPLVRICNSDRAALRLGRADCRHIGLAGAGVCRLVRGDSTTHHGCRGPDATGWTSGRRCQCAWQGRQNQCKRRTGHQSRRVTAHHHHGPGTACIASIAVTACGSRLARRGTCTADGARRQPFTGARRAAGFGQQAARRC